jgi:hypothetical protein
VLTGIFAAKWVAALDGVAIPGGAINGNGYAVGYAFASATSIAAWSFVVTFIILVLINRLPGMQFRCSLVSLNHLSFTRKIKLRVFNRTLSCLVEIGAKWVKWNNQTR